MMHECILLNVIMTLHFFCEVMVDYMFGGSLTIEDSLPILGKYSI